MTEPRPQIILIHETVFQSWVRDASMVASVAALVGIGVFLQSDAMQWVGAIMFFLGFFARASGKAKSCERVTPQQAADHLAERWGVVASICVPKGGANG